MNRVCVEAELPNQESGGVVKIHDEPESPDEATCLRQSPNEAACLRFMVNPNHQMRR